MGTGAKDFTELASWQLAVELRDFMYAVIKRPAVVRDRKFCEQADDAASSAPRNIAEGFGRFEGKEFAQFLKIAIGSEMETRNNVLEAFAKNYITEQERNAATTLSRRAVAAATRLRSYLLSPRNKVSGKRTFREPPNPNP